MVAAWKRQRADDMAEKLDVMMEVLEVHAANKVSALPEQRHRSYNMIVQHRYIRVARSSVSV